MADWTNLPNQAVGVGGLPSGTTVTALRDNPVAIAEGAAGAPRVANAALETIQAAILATNNAARNWVLERTAGAAAGAVGTYAFLGVNNGDHSNTFGQTRAGSSLFPAGIVASGSNNTNGFAFDGVRSISGAGAQNSARAGTWRCMGVVRSAPGQGGSQGFPWTFGASLWLRIS